MNKSQYTGNVEFPPGNRTNWDGIKNNDYDTLRAYLRNVTYTPIWRTTQCLPTFPSISGARGEKEEDVVGLSSSSPSPSPSSYNMTSHTETLLKMVSQIQHEENEENKSNETDMESKQQLAPFSSSSSSTTTAYSSTSTIIRLRESLANRITLCFYNQTLQSSSSSLHFMCNHKLKLRMEIQFYALLFFEVRKVFVSINFVYIST